MSDLPFDGAISAFFENEAPTKVHSTILDHKKRNILNAKYPYRVKMDTNEYEQIIFSLQIELVKMLSWIEKTGQRVAIVFEGRDAAGKGGTIKRFRENLNPRSANVVALSKPSDVEQGQWYFQRYIRNLPNAGEIAFFDRSWYNRAVIEPVFGFCTPEQNAHFYRQTPGFEQMLKDDGITLIKIWLTVGRAEQLRRFLARESDPLKQWKLSPIDVKGLSLWDEYTDAIDIMFKNTHTATSPWNVIRSDDKKRARIAAIRLVLSQLDYPTKNTDAVQPPDDQICGNPESMGFELA